MAGLLLAGRADVNETTTAGKTPLDFAHHLKDAAMIRMLESVNEVSNTETPYRKPVA